MDGKSISEILEKARKKKKATFTQGCIEGEEEWVICSECNTEVVFGNFCSHCGATFLTEEQLKKGELNLNV